jgi:hypothetical protein
VRVQVSLVLKYLV